ETTIGLAATVVSFAIGESLKIVHDKTVQTARQSLENSKRQSETKEQLQTESSTVTAFFKKIETLTAELQTATKSRDSWLPLIQNTLKELGVSQTSDQPIGHSSNEKAITDAIDALYKIITDSDVALKKLEAEYLSATKSLSSVANSSSLSSSIDSTKQALTSKYQQDKQKLEKARDEAKAKLEKVRAAVQDSGTNFTRETLVAKTKQVFHQYSLNDKVVQQLGEKIKLFQASMAAIQKTLEAQQGSFAHAAKVNIASLTADVAAEKKKVEELTKQLPGSLPFTLTQILDSLKPLSTKLSTEPTKVEQLAAKITELKGKVDQKIEEKRQALGRVDQQIQELEQSQQKFERLKQEAQAKIKDGEDNTTLEAESSGYDLMLQKLAESRKPVQESKDALEKEIATLEGYATQLQGLLEKEIASFGATIEETSKLFQRLQEAIARSQQAVGQTQKENQEFEAELKPVSQTIEKLKADISEATQSFATLSSAITQAIEESEPKKK
ncbi:MAG: hypothetical protein HKM07_08575, partial [Chlamydiae bacterium]|nr:hypothetical protein [Chlamydiota bacterium]